VVTDLCLIGGKRIDDRYRTIATVGQGHLVGVATVVALRDAPVGVVGEPRIAAFRAACGDIALAGHQGRNIGVFVMVDDGRAIGVGHLGQRVIGRVVGVSPNPSCAIGDTLNFTR